MAKILETTLRTVDSNVNGRPVVHCVPYVNLGLPLGLYACCTLFSSLLLVSLLGVVGHYHGRERV